MDNILTKSGQHLQHAQIRRQLRLIDTLPERRNGGENEGEKGGLFHHQSLYGARGADVC